MAARARQLADATLTIRPANEASWEDLQKVLSATAPANCQCQRYKMRPKECLVSFPAEERADRLRVQTDPGCADAEATTGLVAYLDDEPVGWCAVEPRTAYDSLVRGGRVAWTGRSEDRTDDSVWAVTCFVTRAGFRRRGIGGALTRAAVEHARAHGARAVEGYPLTTRNAVADELHVGTESMFAAAGFAEVSRPSPRRVVMRVDL
ncbi:GNAT family N-acetyltransferase [Plantactinospora sp. KBS50]|uniref:GNAT family N-acetyltransferase n=1 Tax=Plantactinospora sp. KBS50 TaxID=2024580 RepID=UPI000BAAA6F3|nr:GNAT family N-acetyltransferase [Plantactinospora sp. KBS50]ASW54299.1 GNAT family N-acetyltransferase [Plantactinospora sp. KBS50]